MSEKIVENNPVENIAKKKSPIAKIILVIIGIFLVIGVVGGLVIAKIVTESRARTEAMNQDIELYSKSVSI